MKDPQGGESMSTTAEAPVRVPEISASETLRTVAERMSELLPKGFRTEILGGELVVSPTPSVKHGGVITLIRNQISVQLPAELVTMEVLSLGWDSGDDVAVPDLLVIPTAVLHEEGWLMEPDIAEFALEVVSPGNSRTDTAVKPAIYAEWGIPIFLLADPRRGELVCRWDPRDGAYRSEQHLAFGDPIELPSPLKGVFIETDGLPRYT